MKSIIACVVSWLLITYSQCSEQIRLNCKNADCGEPLLLTPLIEDGQIVEARKQARVQMTDDLGIESYAGYFTVNKIYDSNHFFWYFPSMQNKKIAPVLVWLAGGPGSSSLFTQFLANGPIAMENNSFAVRKLHLALNHHVIYIDNPVGVGFSFTKDPKGYCSDEVQIGEHLFSTVTQFFKLFPELVQHKFYVLGQSYGGKFATALANTIHNKNLLTGSKINLRGLAIASGFCNPERQLIYSEYLYQLGLIDRNAAVIMAEYESRMIKHIQNQQFVHALITYSKMLVGGFDRYGSFFQNITHFNNTFNILYPSSFSFENLTSVIQAVVNRIPFRKAIHVGDQPFNGEREVKIHLVNDIMQSVAPWISDLLEHYQVLIFNGQLDIIVPYTGTVNFLRNLNFSGAEEYRTATRIMWKVDGDLAGYVKQAGKLTEILVRNAGHLTYLDQPQRLWDMLTRFTYNQPFYN